MPGVQDLDSLKVIELLALFQWKVLLSIEFMTCLTTQLVGKPQNIDLAQK